MWEQQGQGWEAESLEAENQGHQDEQGKRDQQSYRRRRQRSQLGKLQVGPGEWERGERAIQ